MENQVVPEVVTQTTNSEIKKCNHIPIIVMFMILVICGFVFGGVELWQNIVLRREKTELELKITELSKNDKNESQNSEILEYEYDDGHIPSTTYRIKLNYGTGELYVYEYRSCSAVDCDGNSSEKTIILSDRELEKVSTITKRNNYDEKYLSDALSSLVRDAEVMERVGDTLWESYKEYDLNSDGVVTYREFGNSYLDSIIEEQS